MPNWCFNIATLSGDKEGIKEINRIISDMGDEDLLFESLIGNDEKLLAEKGWYDHNIERFGTKWDVTTDFVDTADDDEIIFIGSTAWSPPIFFYIELSKKYKVNVSYEAFEPGCDFYGVGSIINNNGLIEIEESSWDYNEGVYVNEGFHHWMETEFRSGEDFVDCFEIEDEKQGREVLKENFPFLNEQEVDECMDDIIEALKETE